MDIIDGWYVSVKIRTDEKYPKGDRRKKKQDGVRGGNGDNEDNKFDDGDELMINGSKMGVGL